MKEMLNSIANWVIDLFWREDLSKIEIEFTEEDISDALFCR